MNFIFLVLIHFVNITSAALMIFLASIPKLLSHDAHLSSSHRWPSEARIYHAGRCGIKKLFPSGWLCCITSRNKNTLEDKSGQKIFFKEGRIYESHCFLFLKKVLMLRLSRKRQLKFRSGLIGQKIIARWIEAFTNFSVFLFFLKFFNHRLHLVRFSCIWF